MNLFQVIRFFPSILSALILWTRPSCQPNLLSIGTEARRSQSQLFIIYLSDWHRTLAMLKTAT